ncbi:hypothetical protein [Streptomyces sp. NPDC050422]|uniref:hypothetical protein n=1 Tax=Streptomyces sp. NPDC050422 TaxID=3365614 RepID=UPI00379A8960
MAVVFQLPGPQSSRTTTCLPGLVPGLDVGLGVTDLFQAVADHRDRDFDSPCGDGLQVVGEDVGREAGGLTSIGRQPSPLGIMNGVKAPRA